MRVQSLSYLLVFAFLTPSLTFSQNQQMSNCHTPESAGNFVGSDETMVNGMVCKMAKTQPAQPQIVAQHSAAPAPDDKVQPTSGHELSITNSRVVEMSKLGLDDDIIIAKIKNGSCDFKLEDTDLVQLKKAGVSPKVIAAMLSTSSLASPSVATNKSDVPSHVTVENKVGVSSGNGPTEAGMYVSTSGGYVKVLGQALSFTRSGSLLVSSVTYGIKSAKENYQLMGPHAQTVTGTNPEFYFIPAQLEADSGVNAGDLILVRLEEKKERRQFEVAAAGAWRKSDGISLTHQVQLNRSEVRPGVYKIGPAAGLSKGEYGLYLKRGEGKAPYMYDFSVE